MQSSIILLSLMAAAASAATTKALHYAVPTTFKAAASNCTMPADFAVSSFEIYTDKTDASKNTLEFQYVDADTDLYTMCRKNSTSKVTGSGGNRYPCENPHVFFIYQTTGIAGLTVIEEACPGNSPAFEASGLVKPELKCTDTYSGTTCLSEDSPMIGDFDSFEPAPPSSGSRKIRRTRLGALRNSI
ncbi:Uu.00g045420.m01.CDS01 [Anthostomella pinea]|uniref:Uu.00g045420.m01.CDS01 n=1 Tax=Anthostomella pinea TaxID=933095 RepID=A0AAI8YC03_9PEZI|nr:Uu.00g045420.m01.CDS01 [Anthostomella pinea]